MKEASPQLKSALLEAQAIGATRAEPSPWRVDPPVAPRRPASVVVHGDVRIDEYAWLRNREDPAVLAYLEAENAYTDAMMAPVDDLREQLFAELVGRIKEDDTTVPEERDGWLYYLRTETGRQYPSVCRRRSGAGQVIETIVLDQNARAVDHDYYRVASMDVSPDHRLLAWTEDSTGAEEYVLRVKEIASDTILPDAIPGTSGNVAWSADSTALYYVTLDSAHRPWRVLRHVIGTDPLDDTVVYEEKDEAFFVGVELTRSREYILIESSSHTTSETRVARADAASPQFQVVRPRKPGIEYEVSHRGDRFYLLTNEGATNFQLVSVPVTNPGSAWEVVVAHDEQVKLDACDAFADHLVVHERRLGLQQLRVLDLERGTSYHVTFPEPVYSLKRHGNPEYAATTFRFTYTSLVTPASVVDYDLVDRTWTTRKEQEVRGYDRTLYRSARLLVPAADGVKVPVSLVWKDPLVLDGRRALYLQGYGAYGVSFDPGFSSNYLSLLDRGVIVAIAHVRGGEEMGRPWYDNGKLFHKKNSFTDFVACAEALVALGYTSPDRLVITGGSAGGLLMGAVTNLRPDLFAAVVADVPFVDVVNTMLDPTLPLTVIEYDEWGNPGEEAAYRYIRSYSPYDNIVPAAYPAMLITAGLNDPRVAYWEPAKYTARLRAMRLNDRPLLLRTNMGAGHSGASGRYDFLREVAFKYAFVLQQLGLPLVQ